MNIRQLLMRVTAAWAALLLFMTLFRPQSLPVVGLIVPFVLLFFALFTLWELIMALRVQYVSGVVHGNVHRRLGAAVCLGVVLLLVLQSLGQLTVRDVITLLAVMLLGYLYLARNQFSVPKH
ncbi:MAG TPA: hypothetical protein VLG92_00035 [Candidatus Saccharimonadia bacterium]|nr:hypothetical protein [Candidatus Saccharimonadia bacterium]